MAKTLSERGDVGAGFEADETRFSRESDYLIDVVTVGTKQCCW